MPYAHGLKPGDVLDNDKLTQLFKCGNAGGMRRSKETNSLVLISDHTKSLYDDRWDGDICHYTGMGQVGDQDINYMQNRTLAESTTNGVDVYLFEVFKPNQYIYRGPVKLAGRPYTERQLDREKNLRTVWVFPVQLLGNNKQPTVTVDELEDKQAHREKQARNLSDAELAKRAKSSGSKAGTRRVSTTVYERNEFIAEYAKRCAKGICQLCDQPAPFSKNGVPFLEVHHIEWLSRGGEDTVENTVALCPNCHRKMHILDLPADIQKLKSRARSNAQTLE
ncbi:hypothetical protein GCM10025857_06970 [Alicyclobacillus contaminans]|uniref:HNH endonuclease n=1 Tax=Alicyclobacillus contaminans TaxID=392016 RepID=UPI00047EF6C0|nr:HNH endonuclease signature motif containing protein [Alicyclobacillus contaminans]GMA49340.1 hypothetical protein GCM10025857_06970 [Alicyclobacillus contaminans]